ncbi:hypothetical protein DLAC_07340 [Tieghemostelium lacteum]|uniref:Uncharacterized protein n=1 Tax=Tieghemostelium lacteum TaxID=361077 RepID=A0A151ZCA3_TIELA|nr:hypothetical protein DLAC_07340 [Tieghemostelium lacteum]|eukprot:KYQ91570.1 hypothetical protein DLAC_07340 [Tieghemostelium lacteum]
MINSYLPEKHYKEYIQFSFRNTEGNEESNLKAFSNIQETNQICYVHGSAYSGKTTLVHYYFSERLKKENQLVYWIDMNDEDDMVLFKLRDLIRNTYFIQDLDKYKLHDFLSLFYETLWMYYQKYNISLIFDGVRDLNKFTENYLSNLSISNRIKIVVILDSSIHNDSLDSIRSQLFTVQSIPTKMAITGIDIVTPHTHLILQKTLLDVSKMSELQEFIDGVLSKLSERSIMAFKILAILQLKELHLTIIEKFSDCIDELEANGLVERVDKITDFGPVIRVNMFFCNIVPKDEGLVERFHHYNNEVLLDLLKISKELKRAGVWDIHALYEEKYHQLSLAQENSNVILAKGYYQCCKSLQLAGYYSRSEVYYQLSKMNAYKSKELEQMALLIRKLDLRHAANLKKLLDPEGAIAIYFHAVYEKESVKAAHMLYERSAYKDAIEMLRKPRFIGRQDAEDLKARCLEVSSKLYLTPTEMQDLAYPHIESYVNTRLSELEEALEIRLKTYPEEHPIVVHLRMMQAQCTVGYTDYLSKEKQEQYNLTRSIEYYQNALSVFEKQCHPFNAKWILSALSGLGRSYLELKNYSQSENYFKQYLNYYKPKSTIPNFDRFLDAHTFYYIAQLNIQLNRSPIEFYEKSYHVYKSLVDGHSYNQHYQSDFIKSLKTLIYEYTNHPDSKHILLSYLKTLKSYYLEWEMTDLLHNEKIDENIQKVNDQIQLESSGIEPQKCSIQ